MAKVLDLFCGLGGWSDGFASEGFEIVGIEINPEIARVYGKKYRTIVADVTTLSGRSFQDFDVIIGSPPCRDFSKLIEFGWKYWKVKPDPKEGLKAVHAFLRIVSEASPRFWAMENVPGLAKHLEVRPQCTIKMAQNMKRSLWGTFPCCLFPLSTGRKKLQDFRGRHRQWERARIPFPIAQTLARQIRIEFGG